MSLFHASLPPPRVVSDEAVRRYLAAIRSRIDPDPRFRRRLRGAVVNQFVAAREGLGPAPRRPAVMGRLGRACLYASLALAMCVGGVMPASRGSLPGELMYPVKLQIEALRLQAFPAEFQDDLAVYLLSQRIYELGRLADAGDWEGALGLVAAIDAAYERLAALGVSDLSQQGVPASRLEVLETLLASLPPQAAAAIEDAMEQAPPDPAAH